MSVSVKRNRASFAVAFSYLVAMSDCALEHQPVLIPRNRKQVANMQGLQRKKIRLTHDALYNLHELSYDLVDFVQHITTYPDLLLTQIL